MSPSMSWLKIIKTYCFQVRDVSLQIRRELILSILTNNRNRFKCGREIKKRTTIWGLRVRLPPPCPVVNLPSSGVIDDSVLRRCWGANKRLQYLPLPAGSVEKNLILSFELCIISVASVHRRPSRDLISTKLCFLLLQSRMFTGKYKAAQRA